jgi:cobalt-zinc-cadmium efflux system protein
MSVAHNHPVVKQRPERRVLLALCLTAIYMVAEAVGGIASNSLSLLADAGHMLADVAALSISLFAFALIARPKNHRASFGHYRAEVLAALFNGVILLLVSFFIIKEAITRFFTPSEIEADLMILVAVGGLFINMISLSLLHRDKGNNLNVRGAWLHILSDTLGSVGVIISGLLIRFFGWNLADPIASIVIAGLVSYSAIHLVMDTLRVLMEHTPLHIDPCLVADAILAIPGSVMVHDLHIWSITSGKEALSVHVVAQEHTDYNQLLSKIQQMLDKQFNINHATIQIENECLVKDKTC